MESNQTLLTVTDVADRLRVHPDKVRQLYRTGQLRSLRVGRCYRFRSEWVDEFLDSAESTPADTRRPQLTVTSPYQHLRIAAWEAKQ